MQIAAHHKSELHELGVTRFEDLVSAAAFARARDQIQQVALDHGVYSANGWKKSARRFEDEKGLRAAINALNHSSTFPDFVSGPVVDTATALANEQLTPLAPGQQILFTRPGSDEWSVPHDLWHIDVPRLGKLGPPGLQAFIFLDDVQAEGGGTLIVAGSHRLLNHAGVVRSKELKQKLAAHAYFRDLFDAGKAARNRPGEMTGSADGVDLKVVELSGQAGDVVFMDLRVLHAPAPNAADTARLMLTCRLPRTAIAGICMSPEKHDRT